jgi:hypothetical protein
MMKGGYVFWVEEAIAKARQVQHKTGTVKRNILF